jgi:hypothetical protein
MACLLLPLVETTVRVCLLRVFFIKPVLHKNFKASRTKATMEHQTEKAYQFQKGQFQHKAKPVRWTNDIGLGFKTPKEAVEGTYIDKKCPFTSNVTIRGTIFK